jgi:hypothetical protein
MVRRLAFVVDEGSHDSFLFLSPENLGHSYYPRNTTMKIPSSALPAHTTLTRVPPIPIHNTSPACHRHGDVTSAQPLS